MAFGSISTLYIPTAANAGTSQWATNVKKLLDSADAGADDTTRCGHGTGGATTRTYDPYVTRALDQDQSLLGWAINPTDMNSVSGAQRFYPAGDHTATIRMTHNALTGATGTLDMYVYRVSDAAGGRARTLLGSGSASVVLPASSGQVDAVVTASLAEILFGVDETIQYSWEFTVAGVAVTGRVTRLLLGTAPAGTVARIDTPTLGILRDTTGTAAGSSTTSAETATILGTTGTSDGVSTASGVTSAISSTTGSAAGTSEALGQLSSVSSFSGSAAGTSTASGLTTKILGTTGTVEIGSGEAPPAEVVNPDFVLTTDGKLEKLVANLEPYPLYLKL